jgi:hypothetical protein
VLEASSWHDERMLSDDELLDFDTSRLAHWEPRLGERMLEAHGPLYRNHLVIAKHLDHWREGNAGLQEMKNYSRGGVDPDDVDTIDWGLKEVAAHLRQGDYLPGGVLYEETIGTGGRL